MQTSTSFGEWKGRTEEQDVSLPWRNYTMNMLYLVCWIWMFFPFKYIIGCRVLWNHRSSPSYKSKASNNRLQWMKRSYLRNTDFLFRGEIIWRICYIYYVESVIKDTHTHICFSVRTPYSHMAFLIKFLAFMGPSMASHWHKPRQTDSQQIFCNHHSGSIVFSYIHTLQISRMLFRKKIIFHHNILAK